MKNETIRIVWSVDPFAESPELQRSAIRVLEELARSGKHEIFPIHVMAAGIEERLRTLPPETRHTIQRKAQAEVDRLVGQNALNLHPLHTLGKNAATLKGGAREIVRIAKKLAADMIVLSTHARRGPKRWLLGSFAEALTDLSEIPVLVARPNWRPTGDRRRILFATDFSVESVVAFRSVVEQARLRHWSVTVFHHVDFPVYPAYEFAFAVYNSYAEDVRELAEIQRSRAEKFAEHARSMGVSVEILVDTSTSLNAADAILKELSNGYLFVALASQSGQFRRVLHGSTTRQLIRRSPNPCWVLHPDAAAKEIQPSTASSDGVRIRGIEGGVVI